MPLDQIPMDSTIANENLQKADDAKKMVIEHKQTMPSSEEALKKLMAENDVAFVNPLDNEGKDADLSLKKANLENPNEAIAKAEGIRNMTESEENMIKNAARHASEKKDMTGTPLSFNSGK
jgi:cytidylate kinase